MSVRKRLHREEPARTAPVRDFSKLYHRPDSMNGSKPTKPISSKERRRASATGPLAEGVELAYKVIDKYIAEGRQTAEGFSSQPYIARAANDNLTDILERMLRFQAEILPLLIEALSGMVKAEPSQNGSATVHGAWTRSNGAQNPEEVAVSIEVVSIRPVQASVELRPNSEPQSLVALGLNAVDPRKPALTKISFEPDKGRGWVKVRIRVPATQPPGTYSGVIVDRDSGETRGTLSICVAD
jgi:hypothetical protein